MSFLKEYGLTITLLLFIFGGIFGMYYYYGIYSPKRDAPMIAEQKIKQDKLDASQKKIDDDATERYKQACEQVELGNRRTLAFQITTCDNDASCIAYAKNTIQVGPSYIATCIHLKEAEFLH